MSHRHVWVTHSSWTTHVRCEICGWAVSRSFLLQSGVYAPCLFWEFWGKVWTSIARREVFRTTGVKL